MEHRAVRVFGGMAPRVGPRLLEAYQAQKAVNCLLDSGELRPFRKPREAGSLELPGYSVGSFALWRAGDDSYWLRFPGDVDVATSPLNEDARRRVYWTGDERYGGPRMSYTPAVYEGGADEYPVTSYALGVPAPSAAPTAEPMEPDEDAEEADLRDHFYVYTYVTALGEEGPPSPPSGNAPAAPGQGVTVGDIHVDSSAGSDRLIERIRIYRTEAGTSQAEFFFVDEIDASVTEYEDTVDSGALGEPLPSVEWDPPPEGLQGLVNLPNGMLAGFEGQGVWVSEAYMPHAWPGSYQVTVSDRVVGLGVFDQHVVVCTENEPVLLTGSDPRGMQQTRLEVNQGCLSKRGIVSLGYAVVYPAPDGLVMVDRSSGARVITEGLLAPRDWAEYKPDTIHAYEWRGGYLAFYDGGAFFLDPRDERSGLVEIEVDGIVAGHRDHLDDTLYLLTDTGALLEWDKGGAPMRYRWRSKLYSWRRPINLSMARVEAVSYNDLSFRLYAGGQLRADKSVDTNRLFPLPSGYVAIDAEIELEGTDHVQQVLIAEAVEAVQG
ncbi:hypothetical protein [Halorhodospira halophila]|uniref:hypothetical protein n=1 Tax=Halorhodospira halophila TaxID=1053 RepID=UPI001913ECA9|nr:hypothetical protein [Halorhodospira halophila]MBK5942704.1 hypothetical protein [Halorhodospira halophila]